MSDDAPPSRMRRIRIVAPAAPAEALAAVLDIGGYTPVMSTRPGEKVATIDVFADSPDVAAALLSKLRTLLANDTTYAGARVEDRPVDPHALTNAWKAHFHTTRVGCHILVRPAWESCAPGPDDIVVALEPGLSFGTGNHPTTRACLVYLERTASETEPRGLLDIGCGSGVLAIAAVQLGFAPVIAIDHDPMAVLKTGENAALNNAQGAIDIHDADIADAPRFGVQPVVVCNVLAHVIRTHAARIAATVAPGGRLILAGILTREHADVMRAFEPHGFRVADTLSDDEWSSSLLIRG